MSEAIAATRTTLKEFFASAGIPRVGEYWPGQGGVNAGPVFDEDGDFSHFLIVGEDTSDYLAWGPYGKKIAGADSRVDGVANTRAILASGLDCPAAKWAAAYTKDDHTDFYLPAQREGNQAYLTIQYLFKPEWHWFSTQFSADGAWSQLFGDGLQGAYGKDVKGLVRAVRRFNPFAI